jgi:putative PIN family toxin of toxin-antitoxin system
MIKVVLDTNVVVSALLNEDGLEGAVLELALSKRLALYVSGPVLAEYAGVLHRPKFSLGAPRIERVLAGISKAATLVDPRKPVTVSRDDADNRFLECAQEADADFLVTGNLKHFPKQWKSTRVVNARQFIEAVALDL